MNSGLLTSRCSLLFAVALCRTALSILIKKLRIINRRTTTSRIRKSCTEGILCGECLQAGRSKFCIFHQIDSILIINFVTSKPATPGSKGDTRYQSFSRCSRLQGACRRLMPNCKLVASKCFVIVHNANCQL